MAGFRSLQTDAARCKQLHLQSLFSFRRLAPADDYLGSPFSASLRPLLLGFRPRFPVASSFFPSLTLPFRSTLAPFRILSFLFFLSALHRFRLPVAFPTPWRLLSSSPDLPLPYRLVSHSISPILLIQLSCLFPFALPCFAPTAVPQVLQLPSGSTLPSADSFVRPFPPVPPSFVSSAVLPLRFRPFRTLLLGLCFFLSLLQASASQWLPLCRPALRFPSSPWVPFLRSARLFQPSFPPVFPSGSPLLFPSRLSSVVRFPLSLPFSPSPFGSFDPFRSRLGTRFCCSSFHRSRFRLTAATSFRLPSLSGSGLPLSFLLPRSPLPLSRFLRFVLLLRSPSRRHLSVSLVRFAPDLVLGSAALLFTAPGFASQLLLPFACLPSRVQAFPLTSFVPFVASRSALPSVRLHAFTLRFPRRPL